jgi:hypothetical protein
MYEGVERRMNTGGNKGRKKREDQEKN